jgi:hypothetical protein
MPKILNLAAVKMTDEIIHHNKVLAQKLGTNRRFVTDMIRGGFKLPCQIKDAVSFLQRKPHPTRFRHLKARPISRRVSCS